MSLSQSLSPLKRTFTLIEPRASVATEATRWQHGRRPCEKRARAGFTLIELLVVVTIISILAAMLLPVLGRARLVAQRTSCTNHLKQIGTAFMMYGDEQGDHYPLSSYPSTSVSWTVSAKEYMNDPTFYRCPSDLSARWDAPVEPPAANYYTTSYIMNAWIAGGQIYGRMNSIRNPSAMVILADANTDVAQRDHFHPFYWVNDDPDIAFSGYMNGITWDATLSQTKELALTRHLGRFVGTYADGHVEPQRWSDVWWRDTARGIYEGAFDPRQ